VTDIVKTGDCLILPGPLLRTDTNSPHAVQGISYGEHRQVETPPGVSSVDDQSRDPMCRPCAQAIEILVNDKDIDTDTGIG
jgi:hypothetical protein